MFISLNFPIADFRALKSDQLGRLAVPAWGRTDPRANFVRGFGSIHSRAKSGVGFVGENFYADCQNFIRYPELKFIKRHKNGLDKILMYPIYRRFFFDGEFCGRFELGFRLNYPTIDHLNTVAAYRGAEVQYDPIEIARQVMRTELELHLLDGRVVSTDAYGSVDLLRDGYLLSSTKTSALKMHDIVSVGSKHVRVGRPFVVIRSTPETPTVTVDHKRSVLDEPDLRAFEFNSGITNQRFDSFCISSHALSPEESARERLTRIIYTQLRLLLFVYGAYLDSVERGQITGRSILEKAIAGLLERLKTLAPIPGDSQDAATCDLMREIIERLDVRPSAVATEIEKTLKSGWLRRNVGKIFGFIDRKSDVAIEAAASQVAERMLSGF